MPDQRRAADISTCACLAPRATGRTPRRSITEAKCRWPHGHAAGFTFNASEAVLESAAVCAETERLPRRIEEHSYILLRFVPCNSSRLPQRPAMHLDFQVDDLASAVAEAMALGATEAGDEATRPQPAIGALAAWASISERSADRM
jgi:hypothetical protein